MRYPVLTASFAAFGSTISITGVGAPLDEFREGLIEVRQLSAAWDQQFSRFRADSLLNRVNDSSTVVEVTPDFLWMLETAIEGARKSGGRFDPAILPALRAAGYREDFDLIRNRDRPVPASAPVPSPGLHLLDRIEIDHGNRSVLLPPGLQLDFGGLAKGAFADRVAFSLTTWPGGCIDAGGDLRVWGVSPDGPNWRIGIEHPKLKDLDIHTVEILHPGASGVATSGVNRRHWQQPDGQMANHLIDPRTGKPVASGPLSVTVFAPTASAAEVVTKAVLIAASRGEPIDVLDSVLAVVTWDDGATELIKGHDPDATIVTTPTPDRQSA